MSVPAPWLAPFVEQCLGAYTGQTSHESIEIKDDGATIHFKQPGFEPAAAILDVGSIPTFMSMNLLTDRSFLQWALGPSQDSAQLMDVDHQIRAVFQRGLSDQISQTPETYQKDKNPRKHTIQLLDFELALIYSASSPDVQLKINKYMILWQKGMIKALTPSKKLRKNQKVKILLDKSLQRVKGRRVSTKQNVASTSLAQPSETSNHQPSQSLDHQQYGTQSCTVLSQAAFTDRDLGRENFYVDRHLLRDPNDLLQHLGQPARAISWAPQQPLFHKQEVRQEVTGQGTEIYSETGIRGRCSPAGQDRCRSTSPSKDSISSQPHDCATNDPSRSELGQSSLSHTDQRGVPLAPKEAVEYVKDSAKAEGHDKLFSQKRPRSDSNVDEDITLGLEKGTDAADEFGPDRAFPKRPRVGEAASCVAPPQLDVSFRKARAITCHEDGGENDHEIKDGDRRPVTDPWRGLTQILASDVIIPKDQVELLERGYCWIPPAPGDPEPRGHVPPALLKQWNEIARARHRTQVEERHKKPDEADCTELASSPESRSSSEIEIDTREDWPSSPVRAPLHLLPESSPVRQTPFASRNEILKQVDQEESSRDFASLDVSDDHLEDPSHTYKPVPSLDKPVHDEATLTTLNDCQPGQGVFSPAAAETEPEHAVRETAQDTATLLSDKNANVSCTQNEEIPAICLSRTGSLTEELNLEGQDQHDDNASDQESVMENTVPIALGESMPPTQESQFEQEDPVPHQASSKSMTGQVQVAVTPFLGHFRPRNGLESSQKALDDPHSLFSSQSNKHSSQSRVANTYPLVESHEKSEVFTNALHASSSRSSDGRSRMDVNVPQTQSSGSASLSQCTSEILANGLIPESSEPNQWQIQPYQRMPEALKQPSSQPFASSVSILSSQVLDSTQGSMMLAPAGRGSSPRYLTNAENLSPTAAQTQSPGTDQWQRYAVQEKHQNGIARQSSDLMAQRAGFLCASQRSAEAHEVFKRFCADYPTYFGDYCHFKELCAKLQAMRDRGFLQRSNLWDDFIIQHLQDYQSYLSDCPSQMHPSQLDYETYFTSHFSKSVNKKRNLSGHSIALVASEYTPPGRAMSTQVESPINFLTTMSPGQVAHSPLTESFLQRFTNFQAHSFREPMDNGLPILQKDPHAPTDLAPSSIDTTSSSVQVKLEGSAPENYQEMLGVCFTPLSSLVDIPTFHHHTQSTREPHDVQIQRAFPPSMRKDDQMGESVKSASDKDEVSNTIVGHESHNADGTENEKQMHPEHDCENEDDVQAEVGAEDSRHETASVELGDETFLSARSQSFHDEIPETQPEFFKPADNEEEGENWFTSLRHIWARDESVWSDHPITPFKSWAEADQNVLSERQRRGGAKILLDKNGVIRRAVHR
ncbi:hypothetical protein POX_b02750 [Penicillium oxalicum]|uniref:hypothetical protein n=1 Tax=Penicillium oxalicum TaxID=69781 RepID=UPI0020B6B6BD|nr:hypothetical protein POX_b02750 [Penicillium oxalicum]KAI2792709.1 hypothetical protein POX_b02750 [Penicillium oxalicum]